MQDVVHGSLLRYHPRPVKCSAAEVCPTLESSWQRTLRSTDGQRVKGRACKCTDQATRRVPHLRTRPGPRRGASLRCRPGNSESAPDSPIHILSLLGLSQDERSDILQRAFAASPVHIDGAQVAPDNLLTLSTSAHACTSLCRKKSKEMTSCNAAR